MTLGTIRREALRLMFASYGDVLEAHTATQLADNPRYSPYMAAMVGSVNRALCTIQARGVMPTHSVRLAAPCVSGGVATFNLAAIDDLDRVERVLAYTATGCSACSYIWEGGTTLVVPLWQQGDYVLVYSPRLSLLPTDCSDDAVLPVPEALAALIPYFVKSELYAEEDAADAALARRYFEQGLAVYRPQEGHSARFCGTYRWEDL